MASLTTSVLRSFDEIEAVRPLWEAGAATVEADPAFFRLICEVRDPIRGPFVPVVWEDGRPVALAVAQLETATLAARFAYARLARFRLPALSIVNGGHIGRDDPATAQALAAAFGAALADGTADLVRAARLPEDAPLRTALAALAPAARRLEGPPQHHRWLDLPDSLDTILAERSAKSRQSLRRAGQKFERAFGDVEVEILAGPDHLGRIGALMDSLESVAAKSYKRGLGTGFHHNEEWRRTLELGFSRGWMRVYLLHAGGRPAAFSIGHIVGGAYHVYPSAYDPGLARYRIGTYLLLKVLEDLCGRDGIERFDYGFGDAEYKRRFSTGNRFDRALTLAAPRARPTAALGTVRTLAAASRASQAAVRRLDLERRLKTLLKKRMARPEDAAGDNPDKG